MVKFCVDEFVDGMLNPREKLKSIIRRSIHPSTPDNASFDNISGSRELADIQFTLNNKGCLKMFCEELTESQQILKNVKVLKLTNNRISHLEPLSMLHWMTLKAIDLSFNEIESIGEFHHLKNLALQNVSIISNPFKTSNLIENMTKILPSLRKIDGIDISATDAVQDNIKSGIFQPHYESRPTTITIFKRPDIIVKSSEINEQIKKDFACFENNVSWSKVIVEHHGKVTKQIILEEMNRKMGMTSFFPCYYKQEMKSDTFYLYQNFWALKILVQKNLSMRLESHNCEIKFELHLNCAEWMIGHADWQNTLKDILNKRVEETKLNLDKIADENFNEVEISIKTFLCETSRSAKNICGYLKTISLQNNRIKNLNFFGALIHFNALISLDM